MSTLSLFLTRPENPTNKRFLKANCSYFKPLSIFFSNIHPITVLQAFKPTTMDSTQNIHEISKLAQRRNPWRVHPHLHQLYRSCTKQLNCFHSIPWITMNPFEWLSSSSYITPIAIPLTKTPNPQILLSLLHTDFERIKIEDGVLETKITGDRIVPVSK